MVKNRLAVLMAERGLKVSKVSELTGISRNALTSLKYNRTKMIRLDTINTLCKLFGITPGEFFVYENEEEIKND